MGIPGGPVLARLPLQLLGVWAPGSETVLWACPDEPRGADGAAGVRAAAGLKCGGLST